MPEMSTSKARPAAPSDSPALPGVEATSALQHRHPSGFRDEVAGVDEQGRRIIRQIAARTPTYVFNCPACVAEDKARMAAPPTLTAAEIGTTLFLIPESDYDRSICALYVRERYPDAQSVSHQFHAEKLAYVKDARIVVVTRRGLNGKTPGPAWKRQKDEEGKWEDFKLPPETYLNEVVESSPIIVADCMDVVPATMFSDGSVDMTELTARVAERAYPFRIAPPADPRDKMFVMRLNS
ncbi:MAG TPA: hypothetical protein VFZ98_07240 [Vicinamibacterales bacterium]